MTTSLILLILMPIRLLLLAPISFAFWMAGADDLPKRLTGYIRNGLIEAA